MGDILFTGTITSTLTNKLNPSFTWDVNNYRDFYFTFGVKSGLFIRLRLKNTFTSEDVYFERSSNRFRAVSGWSSGDIIEVQLHSVSRKIYVINGTYNSTATQYVITNSAYGPASSTTTHQYYWFNLKSNVVTINTSTGVLSWGGQAFSSITNEVIFIDPTSWVFDQYLIYDGTSNFREQYPIYKEDNKYYLTSTATVGNRYYFLTTNGDCFQHNGTMSQISWDVGNSNNKQLNYSYTDNIAPVGSPHNQTQSSDFMKEPQRFLLGQYATQQHQLGLIPYLQENMKGYVYYTSPQKIPSSSYSRTNPFLIWDGSSSDILWSDYADQFTFMVVTSSAFYMCRIPSNWVLKRIRRLGINLENNNVVVENPIHDYNYFDTYLYTISGSIGNAASSLFQKQSSSVNDTVNLTANFYESGGSINETTLSATTDAALTYSTKSVVIKYNLFLDLNHKAGDRGSILSKLWYYDSYSYKAWSQGQICLRIKLTVNQVPIIPGVTAPVSNYSVTNSLTSSGGYIYWPDSVLKDNTFWTVRGYLDNKPSTGIVGTSKALLDIRVNLIHSQDGIVRMGEKTLIKDGSSTAFVYYTDSSHQNTGTFYVDKVYESQGNMGGITVRAGGGGGNHYYTVFIAYPAE